MTKEIDFAALAAEFPQEAIHWRAQSVTKDGTKAMALAYLDARDVRGRLNEVCGPENWTCEHYDCGQGRLGCRLSIRVDGEWITKTDGAGDTQVEAEKGAFSGALKRAAVAWGIGEYLYDMPTPWVPCETYDRGGKAVWSKWTADPWQFVRTGAVKTSAAAMKRGLEEIDADLLDCDTIAKVNSCAKVWHAKMQVEGWTPDYQNQAIPKFELRRKEINGIVQPRVPPSFPPATEQLVKEASTP